MSTRCDLLVCAYLSLLYLFCMEAEITPCLLVAFQHKPGCLQCQPLEVTCAAVGSVAGLSPLKPPLGPALHVPMSSHCGTPCFSPRYPRLFSRLYPLLPLRIRRCSVGCNYEASSGCLEQILARMRDGLCTSLREKRSPPPLPVPLLRNL